MDARKQTVTIEVTEREAQAALRRPAASTHGKDRRSARLSAEEERVMRMRLGASPPARSPLERLATASDAGIELLAYEVEAYLRLKAQRGGRTGPSAASRPAAGTTSLRSDARSRTKEKIVRALRRK